MRLLKYLLALFIALAIVASALHYKRETIARNIANSALRGKGLVATDLSIDTLGTDRIVLSRLVLEQDSGARYELQGIAFPLGFPSLKTETVTIEALRMVPGESAGEAPGMAALMATFLELPDSIPNTTIVVGRLVVGDMPEARDLLWRSSGDHQQFAFSVLSIDATLDVARETPDRHVVTIEAATGADRDALDLTLAIGRRESEFNAEGTVSVHLLPWLPLLHSLALVPQSIGALDTTLAGPLSLQIADDSTQRVSLQGELAIGGARFARYEPASDEPVAVTLAEGASLKLAASYPDATWTAQVERADFLLDSGFATGAEGRLADLTCRNGIECGMRLAFDDVAVDIGEDKSVAASFMTSLNAGIAETTRIDFLPDTSLSVSGFESGNARVATLLLYQPQGTRLLIDESGWLLDAGSAQVNLQGMRLGESLLADVPVSVQSIRVRDDASHLSFTWSVPAGAASIKWNAANIPAPGGNGNVELANEVLSTAFELRDDGAGLFAKISARHRLSSGAGTAEIRDVSLRFDRRNLSGWRQNWPYTWDIVAGDWHASADLAWQPAGEDWSVAGTLSQQAGGLAGHYGDIAFAGLATSLAVTLGADGSIRAEPASVEVALIDVGIPIGNLKATVGIDVAASTLSVRDLEMSLFGGTITADPFVYLPQQPSNNIMLRPQSIQLQFMVDLAEFDDLELTGSISGSIPVTIGEEAITVTDGRLESDAGGGVIRYHSAATVAAEDSGISVVSRALGNFQYDSLTSDVNYTEAGDLKLKMRLSGINPDMDPLQPVILNLGVENNIPQLLRSLQATREIEDVLQRQDMN